VGSLIGFDFPLQGRSRKVQRRPRFRKRQTWLSLGTARSLGRKIPSTCSSSSSRAFHLLSPSFPLSLVLQTRETDCSIPFELDLYTPNPQIVYPPQLSLTSHSKFKSTTSVLSLFPSHSLATRRCLPALLPNHTSLILAAPQQLLPRRTFPRSVAINFHQTPSLCRIRVYLPQRARRRTEVVTLEY
jgi:hypothetical protein